APHALTAPLVPYTTLFRSQHADGPREINELHIPVGKPVKLIMISQDVIHSFFVPAFRTKRDVLPGRYESMWFVATKPGEYHLLRSEEHTSELQSRGHLVCR